jgi:pSer/pThr/pTyr-binding forkhead associated (FHA) protein
LPTLILHSIDGREPQRLLIREDSLLIGRATESDIRLPDSLVSKEHARISPSKDGRLFIQDLRSRNGTTVNGRRLDPFEAVQLHVGDVILLGHSRLDVVEETEDDYRQEPTQRVKPVDPPSGPIPGELTERPSDVPATIAAIHAAETPLSIDLESAEARWPAIERGDESFLARLKQEGDRISGLSDRAAIIESVRNLVSRALGLARVLVIERDAQTKAWAWPSDPRVLRPSMTVINRAVSTRSALLIPDTATHGKLTDAPSLRIGGFKTVIVVPLISGKETLAVLYADRPSGEPFSERDLRLAAIAACRAAAALRKAS